jgi:hypothetical protein
MGMKAAAVRTVLKAQPFEPFLVKTTDGDTFRVQQPDFAMISPVDTEIIFYDKDGHFHIVAMNHIVSVEPVRNGARKPGKR